LRLYLEYGGALFKFISPDEILSHKALTTPDIYILDEAIEYRKELLDIIANAPTKNVLIANKGHEELPQWIDWVLEQPLSYSDVLEMSYKIFKNKRTTDNKPKVKKELSLKDMRILLAEDNPVNRKLAEALLKKMGPQVDMVENGQEAYVKRISDSYHVILMDIEMPVLDGIGATEKILEYEKDNHKEHIPIIALTANTLQETKQKHPDFNMDGLLSKPIKADELKEVLTKILEEKNKKSAPVDKTKEKERESQEIDLEELLNAHQDEEEETKVEQPTVIKYDKNIIVISNLINITRACSISFGRLGIFIKHFNSPDEIESIDPSKDVILLQNELLDKEAQIKYLKELKEQGVEVYVVINRTSKLNSFAGKEIAQGIELTELEIGDGAEEILKA
jgi:CheY-like chemotaxis protein